MEGKEEYTRDVLGLFLVLLSLFWWYIDKCSSREQRTACCTSAQGWCLGDPIRLNTLTRKVSSERSRKWVIVVLRPTAASWFTYHFCNLPLASSRIPEGLFPDGLNLLNKASGFNQCQQWTIVDAQILPFWAKAPIPWAPMSVSCWLFTSELSKNCPPLKEAAAGATSPPFGTTQKISPRARTPHRIGWGLWCGHCVTMQLLGSFLLPPSFTEVVSSNLSCTQMTAMVFFSRVFSLPLTLVGGFASTPRCLYCHRRGRTMWSWAPTIPTGIYKWARSPICDFNSLRFDHCLLAQYNLTHLSWYRINTFDFKILQTLVPEVIREVAKAKSHFMRQVQVWAYWGQVRIKLEREKLNPKG